jgi:hypothetical protein
MALIAEKQLVHAPLASADSLLRAALATRTSPASAGARIVLRAGTAKESVIVEVKSAHQPADMTPRYDIHWEAEDGGAFPIFDGQLTIGADEDYNAFFLVLEGAYEPPGGVAGRIFDVAIGHRIAEASARGLLSELRDEIERHFGAIESAKPA